MSKINFIEALHLLTKAAKIIHDCGVQSRRLEWFLSDLSKSLGYEGSFVVLPNQLSITMIDRDSLLVETSIVKMGDADFNVGKIDSVNNLVNKIKAGYVDLDGIYAQLDAIEKQSKYNLSITMLGYMLSSVGFAGFLQCDYISIAVSGILGCFVCVFSNFLGKYDLGYLSLFLVSFIIAVISSLFACMFPQINPYIVTLSAIIYLIPGFTISTAIMEITYRYTLSGIINFVHGMTSLTVLFGGTYFAILFLEFLSNSMHFNTSMLPVTNLQWVSGIIMAIGFAVILQVSMKDMFLTVIVTFVMCVLLQVSQKIFLNMNIGVVASAFMCMVISSVWSKIHSRPESIILIPSTIFLVSGSIGFRGLLSLTENDYISASLDSSQMFITAACIAIGLILGVSVSRKKQHTL